jgi:hypothetical protein
MLLNRADGAFLATIVHQCDSNVSCSTPDLPVQYVGDGQYAVKVTLSALGEYDVHVRLNTERLNFTQAVVGKCRSGEYAQDGECRRCPSSGVHCDEESVSSGVEGGPGATLATLNLTHNHWRLSNHTTDIRP